MVKLTLLWSLVTFSIKVANWLQFLFPSIVVSLDIISYCRIVKRDDNKAFACHGSALRKNFGSKVFCHQFGPSIITLLPELVWAG